MFCTCNALDKKKKNHLGDAPSDIEESAVWFCHDALMHEVAAVASRVRSRFRSWIKHSDSSISKDSDFMHQQHGSFFFVQGSRWSVLWPEVLPVIIHMWSCIALHHSVCLFIIISEHGLKSKAKKKKRRKHCIRRAKRVTRLDTIFWLSGFDHQQQRFLFFSHQYLPWKGFYHFLLLLFVFCQ